MKKEKKNTLCLYCNVHKQDTQLIICSKCKDINLELQKKLCTNCGVLQDWSSFSKSKSALYGRQRDCKECINKYRKLYCDKRENFLKKMISTHKSHYQQRNTSGGDFDDTYEDVCRTLQEMGDRCAVSGLPMSFKPHSNWKCR